ncbi:MAG: malic enzyme-like NAD(P)-binding protein [Deltaproteobacteria bacterium]
MEREPNWYERYDATHIIKVRLRLVDVPGTFGRALEAIGALGAKIGDISFVGVDGPHKLRDVQLFFVDEAHEKECIEALAIDGVEVVSVEDEVMEMHRGGTIETRSRVRLDTLMDLRMAYTPGVARVCERIAKDPEAAKEFTTVQNKIAIVTNGTAVLGLGDIGALAGLPVMEGKAAILSRFVNVWAEPILVDAKDPATIVETVANIASGYGAIQLEDIAAPACFEVERELQRRVDKPVFHDDQHGTATVCVAGLLGALKKTKREIESVKAVVLGAGAAGAAIARFLVQLGVEDVVLCDSTGALYDGRTERMNEEKERLAKETNAKGVRGSLEEVIAGRDLFIGVSKPKLVTKEMVRSMAKDPIVFALANPVSEISVHDALDAGAAVALDGRGMNNALAYPGLFRGALDARAKRITPRMMKAAAEALAARADDSLLPDMLDDGVHRAVANAVQDAWDRGD